MSSTLPIILFMFARRRVELAISAVVRLGGEAAVARRRGETAVGGVVVSDELCTGQVAIGFLFGEVMNACPFLILGR